jgi:hypothetical protein
MQVSRLIFVVENAPDGGYVARALGTGMSAKAEDLIELRAKVQETVRVQIGDCEAEQIGFFDLSRAMGA